MNSAMYFILYLTGNATFKGWGWGVGEGAQGVATLKDSKGFHLQKGGQTIDGWPRDDPTNPLTQNCYLQKPLFFAKITNFTRNSVKSLSFLEILRVQNPSKITKNRCQGILFTVSSSKGKWAMPQQIATLLAAFLAVADQKSAWRSSFRGLGGGWALGVRGFGGREGGWQFMKHRVFQFPNPGFAILSPREGKQSGNSIGVVRQRGGGFAQ